MNGAAAFAMAVEALSVIDQQVRLTGNIFVALHVKRQLASV
jgi:hypothetical protein